MARESGRAHAVAGRQERRGGRPTETTGPSVCFGVGPAVLRAAPSRSAAPRRVADCRAEHEQELSSIGPMVDFNDAVSLLRAKRQELLDQLNAVEKALAALGDVGLAVTSTSEANPQEA